MLLHYIDLIRTTFRLASERSLFKKKNLLRLSSRPNRNTDENISTRVFDSACCGFILSTGRVGTALLTKLLNIQLDIDAFHVPDPELVYPSKRLYLLSNDITKECINELAISARYDLIRRSWLSGGQYVETNNRITFYAYGLANMFTRSKFVHLIRHPGHFVRSGLRRGYYDPNQIVEGKITPQHISHVQNEWAAMQQIEKVAWLWNETNTFIEKFKSTVQQDRILTIKSEDLFTDPSETQRIIQFLSETPEPSKKKIEKILKNPVNAQREGKIDVYSNWSVDEKEVVKKWTPLAESYGYILD